jgi:hypothetical protein
MLFIYSMIQHTQLTRISHKSEELLLLADSAANNRSGVAGLR